MIAVSGSQVLRTYIPLTQEVCRPVSLSSLKLAPSNGAAAIALLLCGALSGANCAAAAPELARMADAQLARPAMPNGAASLLGRLGRDRLPPPREFAVDAPPAAHYAGPLRPSPAGASADATSVPDRVELGHAVRGLNRDWRPAIPAGTRMPAAHVDLWNTSRARVAVAIHRGVSLQARFVF